MASSKQLRYPLSRIESNSDYLSINVVKYNPPGFESGSGNDSLNVGATNNGSSNCAKKQIEGNILLPMPDGILDSNTTNWESNEINSLAASAIGNIKQGLDASSLKDIKSDPSGFIQNLVQSGQTTADNALRNVQDPTVRNALSTYLVGQGINLFGSNLDATSLISREQGVVLNPNKEFLFKGVELRAFDFTFVLNPRDRNESAEIKAIINTFKRRMAAKSSAEASGPRGLFIKAPDVFELEFKRGSKKHPFLYTMKTCALTKISVDYMRTGNYITYEDSTPVQMAMALSFTELNPVYAEDYNSISLEEGVGF